MIIRLSFNAVSNFVFSDLAPASSLSSYHGENGKNNGNSNRPELKRYRQYTRHDIAAAIEAVRSGQSALQASRLYGVPSRTLYDKVRFRSTLRNSAHSSISVFIFYLSNCYAGEEIGNRDWTALPPIHRRCRVVSSRRKSFVGFGRISWLSRQWRSWWQCGRR